MHRFMEYNKEYISLAGPSTDELVKGGVIKTPYPRLVCDRNFPLRPRNHTDCAVLVPITNGTDDFSEMIQNGRLLLPAPEHAIRFAAGPVAMTWIGKRKKFPRVIVFPHNPEFILPGGYPAFLTLVRRTEGFYEVCLYHSERYEWPENTVFTGIAA
jgi:hypothetical protein